MNPPVLDSSNDSLEIINTFTEYFYETLRGSPKSISSLLSLQARGNKMATEIIKYLISTPPLNNRDIEKQRAISITFSDLGLGVREYNCIRMAKINSVYELVQYTAEELMKFRNFGQKSLSNIELALSKKNLRFGMKFS